MNTVKGNLIPLNNNILVTDMNFEEQKTASGIIILKIDQYRGTRGLALKKTTFKMWRIFFFARSGTWLLSSLSAFNISHQIFGTQRQPGRTSVDQYPHGLTVRFTKDVNSKNLSE